MSSDGPDLPVSGLLILP